MKTIPIKPEMMNFLMKNMDYFKGNPLCLFIIMPKVKNLSFEKNINNFDLSGSLFLYNHNYAKIINTTPNINKFKNIEKLNSILNSSLPLTTNVLEANYNQCPKVFISFNHRFESQEYSLRFLKNLLSHLKRNMNNGYKKNINMFLKYIHSYQFRPLNGPIPFQLLWQSFQENIDSMIEFYKKIMKEKSQNPMTLKYDFDELFQNFIKMINISIFQSICFYIHENNILQKEFFSPSILSSQFEFYNDIYNFLSKYNYLIFAENQSPKHNLLVHNIDDLNLQLKQNDFIYNHKPVHDTNSIFYNLFNEK